MKQYYKICPTFIHTYSGKQFDGHLMNALETITVPMSDREIIFYLEEKTRLLEKTLSNLKQYVGDDYFKASVELEEFLKNFKIYEEKK